MFDEDDSWVNFMKSVQPLKQDKVVVAKRKPKPKPALRLTHIEERCYAGRCVLGARLYAAMKAKQGRNLISHVYNNRGVGAPPVSGGKIEGKKRTRLW